MSELSSVADDVRGAEQDDFLPPTQHGLLWLLDTASAVLNALGTLLIVGIMVAINLDIFGRSLFNHPIAGVPEIVSMSIVAVVFLQVAHSLRLGGLTRAEVLLDRIPVRARAGLEALYCLIGFGFCAILFNGLLPLFERAWSRNLYVGSIGDFTAPVWPVRLIMLIGTVALALQFLMRALRAAMYARRPSGGTV